MKSIITLFFAMTMVLMTVPCMADDSSTESSGSSTIILNGKSAAVEGSGASVSHNIITISEAGTYTIKGTLNDGQVRVDTDDSENVDLVLDGAHITCSDSAPIYIVNAEKTVITLAEGSANSVKDGASYVFDDAVSKEPNAAIFSKDDLTIEGGGSLTVDANYHDGITSKDDLKITGGTITTTAQNDGISGRDSVTIKGGIISVKADGDGIQSDNDEQADKGVISIEDGTLNIVAGADAMQANTSLMISGGTITITSGGGAGSTSTAARTSTPVQNSRFTGMGWGTGYGMGLRNGVGSWTAAGTSTDSDTTSGKGLKSGVSLDISGGRIIIDSADDAIHSHGGVAMSGGDITVASGDDAVHAESAITLSGGAMTVTKCYEGLESSAITINDGTFHITASDDAVNAVSDADSTTANGQPGQWGFEETGTSTLNVNGGYLVIDAGGDGLDIGGPITMTGGTVLINGPTYDGDGAIDYLGSFVVSGGYLVAAGSSGMAMAPSTSSGQYSVMMNYPSKQAAGTMVHIGTADGREVLTFVPTKVYQSIVFSSPALHMGSDYVIYSGGSSTGSATDGLYSGGDYTPGTKIDSFTLSDIVTTIGSSYDQMPGPMNQTPAMNRTGPNKNRGFGNGTGTMPGMPNGQPGNGMNNIPPPGSIPGGMGSAMPGNRTITTNGPLLMMPQGSMVGSMQGYLAASTSGLLYLLPGSGTAGVPPVYQTSGTDRYAYRTPQGDLARTMQPASGVTVFSPSMPATSNVATIAERYAP